MSYRYPVLLDVTDRPSVIVGGGAVAARKAAGLLAAGATGVRVVAPEFHPDMPAGVERVAERYDARHLHGAQLVFAATDSADVNDAVVRDARRMGAWVNRADVDDDLAGDFTVPAQLHHGPAVLVTVSAAGSPALAAAIRDRLRPSMDDAWAKLADALTVLRPRIRACRGLTASRRRALLRDLATDNAMAVLRDGGDAESLWRWASRGYPELVEESQGGIRS